MLEVALGLLVAVVYLALEVWLQKRRIDRLLSEALADQLRLIESERKTQQVVTLYEHALEEIQDDVGRIVEALGCGRTGVAFEEAVLLDDRLHGVHRSPAERPLIDKIAVIAGGTQKARSAT